MHHRKDAEVIAARRPDSPRAEYSDGSLLRHLEGRAAWLLTEAGRVLPPARKIGSAPIIEAALEAQRAAQALAEAIAQFRFEQGEA